MRNVFMLFLLCLLLFPVCALGETVAKIAGTSFETLDEAIEAVQTGVQTGTIEIVADCSTSWTYGQRFLKDMTIDGNHHTIAFTAGFCIKPGTQTTFKNATVNMNAISYGKSDWSDPSPGKNKIVITVNPQASLNVENCNFNITNSTNKVDGIYMHAGAAVNVVSSNVNISQNGGNGLTQDSGNSYLRIKNSTMNICQNQWNGITGPNFMNIQVDNSTLNILENHVRGVHCGKMHVMNGSVVTAARNNSDGLNLNELIIEKNSVVSSSDNGAIGIRDWGIFKVDGTSQLLSTGNAKNGGAGLRLSSSSDILATAEKGAVIRINNNLRNGLENYRPHAIFEEGVLLEIMGNNEQNNGGGVYNDGGLALPSDAKIYNNHAGKSGDDIYCSSDASISFGPVGTNWFLDGSENMFRKSAVRCKDQIDGWYVDISTDQGGQHWNAHSKPPYTELRHPGSVSGSLALKAAHAVPLPTPSPSPVPTMTPSPSPKPIPTVSPVPTASPKPIPTVSPVPTASPKPIDLPKTGDETPLFLFVVLMISSLLGLVLYQKHHTFHEE